MPRTFHGHTLSRHQQVAQLLHTERRLTPQQQQRTGPRCPLPVPCCVAGEACSSVLAVFCVNVCRYVCLWVRGCYAVLGACSPLREKRERGRGEGGCDTLSSVCDQRRAKLQARFGFTSPPNTRKTKQTSTIHISHLPEHTSSSIR